MRLRRVCSLAVPFLLWSLPGCGHPADAGVSGPGGQRPAAAVPAPEVGAISGPYAHGDLQVWLVHGPDQHRSARPMVPLAAALERGIAVVHETGNVNELAIENVDKDVDVFVQSGDIVQGGQQDRTIGVDLVLAPRSGRVPLPSFCVEHGRWSVRGGGAAGWSAAGGVAPQTAQVEGQVELLGAAQVRAVAPTGAVRFLSSSNSVATKEMRRAVLVEKDQQRVWSEVADTQAMLATNLGRSVQDDDSPSSLELTLETKAVKEATERYVKELQGTVDGHPDTIGCVVAIAGRLDSADVYGSHALFTALWPKLLRAAATAAVAGGEAIGKAGSGAGAAASPTLEQVRAFLCVAQGERQERATAGGVQMAIGETAVNYAVDSKVGGGLLHRTYLAK